MEGNYQQRGGDRRRDQRPCSVERRVRQRRTGIEVEEISPASAGIGLSRALEKTALSPLEQALFELLYADSVGDWD